MNEDKGKSSIQKTANSKDYEIKTSFLLTSPIQSPNRFQVLGNFPPLPFAVQTPIKSANTSKPQSDSSPYFTKKNPDNYSSPPSPRVQITKHYAPLLIRSCPSDVNGFWMIHSRLRRTMN